VPEALARHAAPAIPFAASVADLAAQVSARHPGLSSIRQRADGSITVAFDDGGSRGVERVDPATGAGLGPYQVSRTTRFITDLHRSFLAGDAGRAAAGIGALAMLALSVSGAALLARRLGGARALLRPIRGTPAQRWHGELGRLAVAGLLLSSLTGLWMSAGTFGLILETPAITPAVTATAGRAVDPRLHLPPAAPGPRSRTRPSLELSLAQTNIAERIVPWLITTWSQARPIATGSPTATN